MYDFSCIYIEAYRCFFIGIVGALLFILATLKKDKVTKYSGLLIGFLIAIVMICTGFDYLKILENPNIETYVGQYVDIWQAGYKASAERNCVFYDSEGMEKSFDYYELNSILGDSNYMKKGCWYTIYYITDKDMPSFVVGVKEMDSPSE